MKAELTLALLCFATVAAFLSGEAHARREERELRRRRRARIRSLNRGTL